jgi:hypothetical protein
MIFIVFLFITHPSGLLQKDFSTTSSSVMDESDLADLFTLPLTFAIASSLIVSGPYLNCVLSRDHTCPEIECKWCEVFRQNFSERDLGPFRDKVPVLVHRLLYRCPVVPWEGFPPNRLRTISRLHLYISHIWMLTPFL